MIIIVNMNFFITKKHDLIRLEIYFYLAKQFFTSFISAQSLIAFFADSTYVSKLVLVTGSSSNNILFTCQHSKKTVHTPHNVLHPLRHSSFLVSLKNTQVSPPL